MGSYLSKWTIGKKKTQMGFVKALWTKNLNFSMRNNYSQVSVLKNTSRKRLLKIINSIIKQRIQLNSRALCINGEDLIEDSYLCTKMIEKLQNSIFFFLIFQHFSELLMKDLSDSLKKYSIISSGITENYFILHSVIIQS